MSAGKTIRLKGRVIGEGRAAGAALKGMAPLSFFGGVDPDSGRVVEKGHDLEGKTMAGRVLVLPGGKGSTVGSYILYRMAKAGIAPAALVLAECDSVIATGVIIADIPCIDQVDIGLIDDGDEIEIENDEIVIRKQE